jgi:adenylyltransferase/sulfurtransferase
MTEQLHEITAKELSEKMLAGNKFAIVDVREIWELNYARLNDARVINIPTSQIGRLHQEAFPLELRDPDVEIVLMCHHGVRSANAALWMMQNGWKNVSSLAGGIDAYAAQIDPTVGKY